MDETQNNIEVEKPVSEFVKGVIYESNVVVTNPTSALLTPQIITEIP